MKVFELFMTKLLSLFASQHDEVAIALYEVYLCIICYKHGKAIMLINKQLHHIFILINGKILILKAISRGSKTGKKN